MNIKILEKFPKIKTKLPTPYDELFEQEHLSNRKGGNFISNLAKKFESWMHKKIAKRGCNGNILEIGAGTLNHIHYEKNNFSSYDIVETVEKFYATSANLKYVNAKYQSISQVPLTNSYDKIISIAVLEHADNLPEIIARSALMLKTTGIMQHAIPTEGAFLWGAAWRLTTGLSFRLRTGLNYKTIFDSEHINEAKEIMQIFKYFFTSVKFIYYPLPFFHGSCYTYIEATRPNMIECKRYLDSLR